MIRLSGLSEEENSSIIPENTILLGYAGSIAHNTHIPPEDPNGIDDKDVIGICIAPINCYLGLQNMEQKISQYKEYDVVVYEIRKIFRLLLKGNPNVLGLLYLQPNHYIHVEDTGRLILDNRDIFLGKHVYHSFIGYAHGQFKRMAHITKEGYMGEKRKYLVEKYHYDTKCAAHLIRLLRMGIEYLVDGELHVFREDSDELKSIKKGEWPLSRVEEEAGRLFTLAQEAYVRSTLPAKPDYHKAEEILIEILRRYV